jgi:hypothetical protein
MTRTLVRFIAAALVLTASLVVAPGSAQAASYRTFQTVKDGTCLRPHADPRDVRAERCHISPVTRGDWQVISKGAYNGHPLWMLRNRKTGTCLHRGGNANELGYLGHSKKCTGGDAQRWEVFTVKHGTKSALVLKSFGAFTLANGRHACMVYRGDYYTLSNVTLAGCNTKNIFQRWRR